MGFIFEDQGLRSVRETHSHLKAKEWRKKVVDQYLSWAENWGLLYAFSITQSVEKAEKIVADALVALISSEVTSPVKNRTSKQKTFLQALPTANAVRFAHVLWEYSQEDAFRGYGNEAFFKLSVLGRAVVVLKLRAQFSRMQIAEALKVSTTQVDDQLENSRLLFSAGKSWVSVERASKGLKPTLKVVDTSFRAPANQDTQEPCRLPSLHANPISMDRQTVFAHYVGNDLEPDRVRNLHHHLSNCDPCRKGFVKFKDHYFKWIQSLPTFEMDESLKKHLQKISKQALKQNRNLAPSPWPGLKRLMRAAQVQAILLIGFTLILLHKFVLKK